MRYLWMYESLALKIYTSNIWDSIICSPYVRRSLYLIFNLMKVTGLLKTYSKCSNNVCSDFDIEVCQSEFAAQGLCAPDLQLVISMICSSSETNFDHTDTSWLVGVRKSGTWMVLPHFSEMSSSINIVTANSYLLYTCILYLYPSISLYMKTIFCRLICPQLKV